MEEVFISILFYYRTSLSTDHDAGCANLCRCKPPSVPSWCRSSTRYRKNLLNSIAPAAVPGLRRWLVLKRVSTLLQTVRDKCFTMCITSPSSSLSNSEQKCLSRCMDRYQDVSAIFTSARCHHEPFWWHVYAWVVVDHAMPCPPSKMCPVAVEGAQALCKPHQTAGCVAPLQLCSDYLLWLNGPVFLPQATNVVTKAIIGQQ